MSFMIRWFKKCRAKYRSSVYERHCYSGVATMLLVICQQLSTYLAGEGVFMRFAFSVWCHHHSADSQNNNCYECSLESFVLNAQTWQRTNINNKPILVAAHSQTQLTFWFLDFIFGILPGYSGYAYLILLFIKILVSKLLFPLPPHHVIPAKWRQVLSWRYCYSSGPALHSKRPHKY